MSAQKALERIEGLRAEHESPLLPAVQAVLNRMAVEASTMDVTQSPLEEKHTQEDKISQPSTRFRAGRRTKEAHG